MVKCGVLFEVRTEILNIIYTTFNFKELNNRSITTKSVGDTSESTGL
jgi:hypothetical protein